MSQAGGSISVEEADPSFYDVYQGPESDTCGDWTKFNPVYPENKGSNLENYNESGATYRFTIPDGTYDTMNSYFTIDAVIYQGTANEGKGTPVAAYEPAMAATRITIQNGANSFFQSVSMMHNNIQIEHNNNPSATAILDSLCSTWPITKAGESNNFTYIDRCPVFDAAGGAEFTATTTAAGTAPDVTYTTKVIRNVTDFDPSFEKRCRITGVGNSTFQISGKIPLSLFQYRSMATRLDRATVDFIRANDSNIIENRSSGVTARVVIKKMTLWMKEIQPSTAIIATISEGVAKGTAQTIVGRRWQHAQKEASTTYIAHNFTQALSNVPSKIFVAFRNGTQIGHGTWGPNNVNSVVLRLGGRVINDTMLNVAAWNKGNQTRALYEHFIAATGQGGVNGEPCLSYEQFISNYAIWAFDTSPSATNSIVLAKEPINLNIDARLNATGDETLYMDVFAAYDGAYTISGGMGQPTPVY